MYSPVGTNPTKGYLAWTSIGPRVCVQQWRIILKETACAAVFIWRAETEASLCLPRARSSYTPSNHRLKNEAFEAFRASSQLCSIAAFVPVLPQLTESLPEPFPSARAAADTHKSSADMLTLEVCTLCMLSRLIVVAVYCCSQMLVVVKASSFLSSLLRVISHKVRMSV
jgi:hypothetical protein